MARATLGSWWTRGALAALVGCLAVALAGHAAAGTSSLSGDANCDGRVDSIDAMLVLKSAAGLLPTLACPDNADVDFHPGLTSQDALLILQYHAALLRALPPEALQGISTQVCAPTEYPSDGTIIATEMLIPKSHELLLDRHQRDTLAEDIDGVLALIRSQYPNMNNIHAWPIHLPTIFVEPDPELMQTIRDIVSGGDDNVTFITGNTDFDLLNARLGLQGIHVFRISNALVLCLDDYLNVPAAVDAYTAIEGVLGAYPDFLVGDGPSVAALKIADTWYVLFRDAWGDCPSGCTEGQLYYFSVSGDRVSELAVPKPGADAKFDALLNQMLPWRS